MVDAALAAKALASVTGFGDCDIFLLFLAMVISDVGTVNHIWRGPIMMSPAFNMFGFVRLLGVMVLMSLFAGLIVVARNRLHA